MTHDRRDFVRQMLSAMIPIAAIGAIRQDGTVQIPANRPRGGVAADTLAFPLNTPSQPVGPLDNDPGVIAIERKLRCTCGCTLDVYTCRTTDFACTYSPAMHRDVVAQVQRGESADAILKAFVEKDGASVLMSPPASGFNVMGYLVPGLTIAAVGLGLVAWLTRGRSEPVPVVVEPQPEPLPDAARLERLQRALDDVES